MTSSNGQGGSALSLDERKAAARVQAKAIMERCDQGAASIRISMQLWANIPPGTTVGGFYPLGREPDVIGLLWQAWEGACVYSLPRTPRRGLPLAFHRWAPGDALVPERFGTMSSAGPPVEPDLLLVPMLAFDRRGHRLGYGGGYYDRTIAAMPGVRTIGVAYAALELSEVPTGPYDMKLGAIATEREFITIESPPCASSS